MRKLILPVVASVMILISLGHMSWSFYSLLRVVLCLVFVLAFVSLRPEAPAHHRVLLVALAVIYNPVLPVHLGSKDLWGLVNIGSAIYLWVVCLRFGKGSAEPIHPQT